MSNSNRRTLLKGIGGVTVAGAVGMRARGASAEATLDSEPELAVYATEAVDDLFDTDPTVVVGDAFWSALDGGCGIFPYGVNYGINAMTVPADVTDVAGLHNHFASWVQNQSDSSPHSNVLVAREDRFGGEWFGGQYRNRAKSSVPAAVTLGARAISFDLSTSPSRYGNTLGDYWLNRALLAVVNPVGVVEGHGRVYTDSSVSSGTITTPGAPMENDQNVCSDSSVVTESADTYDHYYSSCTCQVLSNAFS